MIKLFGKNRSGFALGPRHSDLRVVAWLQTIPQSGFVLLLSLFCVATSVQAQSDSLQKLPSTAYIFGGVSGFIPFKQSYRINFATSLGGIPIEVNGGLSFPVSQTLLVPVTIRYIRRTANYVDGLTLTALSVEPGVHIFLDPYRPGELRFFGGASLLLSRATVSATINGTSDGTTLISEPATHQYLNFGIGLDLGLTYELTPTSALDGGIHLGVLLSNPTSHGGLGDIGGVSLGAVYRFGF